MIIRYKSTGNFWLDFLKVIAILAGTLFVIFVIFQILEWLGII